MTVYEFVGSSTTVGGSVSSTTLTIQGGLLRQVLIQANTATTLFRANLQDSRGRTRLNYAYHNGEINDTGKTGALPLPVAGVYTINITNASPDDMFQIVLGVQE